MPKYWGKLSKKAKLRQYSVCFLNRLVAVQNLGNFVKFTLLQFTHWEGGTLADAGRVTSLMLEEVT